MAIPLSPGTLVGLPHEGIIRLSDQRLLHEQFDMQIPAVLDELASTNPAIAETVQGLTMELFWETFYRPFVYHEPSESARVPHGIR
jgi:hypothetical protein